ncbi:MAG: hypothetical protein PSX36_06600 [bacterium]|nr:hypothetical protein [bacterium]
MRLFLLFGVGFSLFLLGSCKKYQPADPAFFMRANKISITPTDKQGSGSHKITDLWLYVNGQFQGCYPVGNLMPIVSKNEKVTIDILPGIKNNGISDTRIFYPMYTKLEFDTTVASGTTLERAFTFQYKTSTIFPLIEGFEGGANGFNFVAANSDTIFHVASPEDSYEGNCIEMGLSGRSLVGKIESSIAYALPHGTSDVYLELNYKCSAEIQVGVIGDDLRDNTALLIGPKSEWNKIYVQLATVLNSPPLSNKYKIFFKLLNKDVAEPRMFLDNIKLVYLP